MLLGVAAYVILQSVEGWQNYNWPQLLLPMYILSVVMTYWAWSNCKTRWPSNITTQDRGDWWRERMSV